MSSMYRGKLSTGQQVLVKSLVAKGMSVRAAAKYMNAPYGQVRGYIEWLNSTTPQETPEVAADGPRVLIFDIEYGAMELFGWDPSVDYIGHYMVNRLGYILAWSAKWYREPEIFSGIVTSVESEDRDDKRIVEDLAKLLRTADIVIGHNVVKHDLKKTRGRILLHGLETLPPIRAIDTLTVARRDFGFDYNGMEPLLKLAGLNVPKKIGMDNWIKAMQGDSVALGLLNKYSIEDAQASEDLFEWMKPYVQRLIRMVDGPGWKCPICGSIDLVKRGEQKTQVSTFQRSQCSNCERYSRTKSLKTTRLELQPL